MKENSSNVIIVEDRMFYRILYGVMLLIAAVMTFFTAEYLDSIYLMIVPYDVLVFILFVASLANKIKVYEDRDYIDVYTLFIRRRIYYREMEYFMFSEEGTTVMLTVYDRSKRKLFKVNMIAKTNADIFSNRLIQEGVMIRK